MIGVKCSINRSRVIGNSLKQLLPITMQINHKGEEIEHGYFNHEQRKY